jgi:hypothetical protein
MNKLAYEAGAQQALIDAGVVKESMKLERVQGMPLAFIGDKAVDLRSSDVSPEMSNADLTHAILSAYAMQHLLPKGSKELPAEWLPMIESAARDPMNTISQLQMSSDPPTAKHRRWSHD